MPPSDQAGHQRTGSISAVQLLRQERAPLATSIRRVAVVVRGHFVIAAHALPIRDANHHELQRGRKAVDPGPVGAICSPPRACARSCALLRSISNPNARSRLLARGLASRDRAPPLLTIGVVGCRCSPALL